MKKCAVIFLCFLIINELFAQEAQWRGPDRSGIFPEQGLLQEWPENGPEMILKVDNLGKGYSTPMLDGDMIYVTGKEGDDDFLYAVNLQGETLYKVKYGRSWENSYPETRSTPTIEDNRLYLISGMGEVVCLNKDDGNIIWSVNAYEKYDGELHRWGVAESPLVIDDKVIYTNGGNKTSVIALDKLSGEEKWTTESVGGTRTYVSPVIYRNGDVRQILASTSDYVIGINPQNGHIDWKYYYLREPKEGERQVTISPNSAIIKGNEVFISKGYDSYGVMLTIAEDGKSVTEKWRTEVMDTHHGHYVNVGDYIYGSNWLSNSQGNWVCLKWDTGEVMFEEKWKTKGPIAYADNRLYLWEERTGNFALVNPTPQKFDIVSSFRVQDGSGPYWAHPYIADGKLLLRHGEVLLVYDIKS
jgi:outer membrane protein assembly factor BamB